MVAVHQVLPVFALRDAIGNNTVAMRTALHAMGIRSEIFASIVEPGARHGARSIDSIKPKRMVAAEPTAWMYHCSTGSPVGDWWAALPGTRILDYHNISPAELLRPWEPHVGIELDHGRQQLADLASSTDFALAVSAFNADELRRLGYPPVSVVPILLDTEHLADEAVDRSELARLVARKRGAEWLFVSRIQPHKAQHDLVKAFAAYLIGYDSTARLSIVGRVGSGLYAEALTDFVAELGIAGSVDITGSIADGELGARYRAADVYVSLSDHEGFGVPLLEAMAHDLPVIAFGSTAVPETVGDAAVVLDDKHPTTVAAAVHLVMRDAGLREGLVAAGRRRLTDLGLPTTTAIFRRAITTILQTAGMTEAATA